MALITCPDCGAQVSDLAPACRGCGRPIAAETTPAGAPVTTVQGTSKRLKTHVLIAAGLFWGGLLMLFAASGSGQDGGPLWAFGPLAMTVGLVWYLATKARIWWHHD